MIRWWAMWFLVGCLLGLAIREVYAAPPPPRPNQPHPDIYQVPWATNLQDFSPLNQLAKAQHSVRYRLVTGSGCSAGSIPADIQRAADDAKFNLRFALVRDDFNFNFTVYINCGSVQIRLCGSVNIYCLPYGWPNNSDVSLSDLLSTYDSGSQIGIPEHEILGHAIAVWEEQYCKGIETTGVCAGLVQFTPAPNWPDLMNTGPGSRHGLTAIEIERWSRTMYDVLLCESVGYDPCTGRWFQPDGWSWDPNTGYWWNPEGQAEWSPCNQDNLRWNIHISSWVTPGSGFFEPARGYWAAAPACP